MASLPFDPLLLAVATATFLLAGFVKGVVGLGLPTVSMGLLTLVLSPAQAASLLLVPSFVTNVWQLLAGPSFRNVALRLWPAMVAIVIGTLAGGWLMGGAGDPRAVVALGIALVAYAVLGLSAVRFAVPPRAEWWLGPIVGVLTGLVTAVTGVFVIPAVPYLGALGLTKEDLIQALGLSFTVSMVALALALAETGAFRVETLAASAAALLPALAGMALGGWVRGRVSEALFRRCFFLGLLTLGLHLASRALA